MQDEAGVLSQADGLENGSDATVAEIIEAGVAATDSELRRYGQVT